MGELLYKELSYEIQGAFFEVYKSLGNGFKENVYHEALKEELSHRNFGIESEKKILVYYRGKKVGTYVPDLIVNTEVLIEIKCKPVLSNEDVKQFWYYLKGSEYKVGYLVNFGRPARVEFIRRVYDTARKCLRVFA